MQLLPAVALGRTPEVAIVLEDVEHGSHLGEDEDAVALGLERGQQPVQHLQLAARLNQRLVNLELAVCVDIHAETRFVMPIPEPQPI
jgi:hypothetical protein